MPNYLINEKTFYLLQHTQNSVDWHPWGAKAEDTPSSSTSDMPLAIGTTLRAHEMTLFLGEN
jgi:uncharacterized protein YyaL (SSP411 family)